jgi:predicted permease
LLTESLVLSLLGAAAGIALAFAAGEPLMGFFPQSISGSFRFQHGIDAHVLGFVLALSVGSVLFSGLLPALRASDQNLAAAGRANTAGGGRTSRLRQWLIVAQVAASVVVLATSGIFVRSFQRAQAIDPGFDSAHLLTVDLDLRELKYSPARRAELYRQLASRAGILPGVISSSVANLVPLGNTRVVAIPGQGEIATAMVDSDYFRTMGIPILRGRVPRPDERNVVIVNEALARRLWPNQDAIGRSVRLGRSQSPHEVIGLTDTGKYWSLTEPARPFLYQVSNQITDPWACLLIRTTGSPRGLAPQVVQEIQRNSPDVPAMSIRTGQERLSRWLQPQRAAAVLLSTVGLAALGLAITGLYALLAQLVDQRRPEIAVRVALGASRAAVAGMLLRQSGLLIGTGTATGIAISSVVARLLAGLAGEVHPLDGATLFGVELLLAVVGAAATLAPACRAMRIDPASTLRAD